MPLQIRAIVEGGKLQIIDKVDLPDGQKIMLHIEPVDEFESWQMALNDLVEWNNPSQAIDSTVETELLAKMHQLFGGGDKPLSETLIEGREDRI